MERLSVTDGLVRGLVDEVAPLVAEATQWGLAVESLAVRVLPRDRGYEEVVLGRLRGVGIDVEDEHPRGIIERLIEYVVEGNVLAAYEPSTSHLLVVRENVDDSNLDGLRLVVGHELVHRGQHINHGELFGRVDRAIRDIFRRMDEEALSFREMLALLDEITPVMALLESHAAYVQELLRETHFPHAVIESHFSLPALLLRLFGRRKLTQYREALPEVQAAVQSGKVDDLYRSV